MGRQGRYLSQEQIQRTVWLLSMTELTFIEIAHRMSVSKATVSAINRKCRVRDYLGLRRSWSINAPAATSLPATNAGMMARGEVR